MNVASLKCGRKWRERTEARRRGATGVRVGPASCEIQSSFAIWNSPWGFFDLRVTLPRSCDIAGSYVSLEASFDLCPSPRFAARIRLLFRGGARLGFAALRAHGLLSVAQFSRIVSRLATRLWATAALFRCQSQPISKFDIGLVYRNKSCRSLTTSTLSISWAIPLRHSWSELHTA